jgi:hypothetical protein
VDLLDFGRRAYAPALGRFISRDPIGEAGGANLYHYCGNDPINKIDPIGMAPEKLPTMVVIADRWIEPPELNSMVDLIFEGLNAGGGGGADGGTGGGGTGGGAPGDESEKAPQCPESKEAPPTPVQPPQIANLGFGDGADARDPDKAESRFFRSSSIAYNYPGNIPGPRPYIINDGLISGIPAAAQRVHANLVNGGYQMVRNGAILIERIDHDWFRGALVPMTGVMGAEIAMVEQSFAAAASLTASSVRSAATVYSATLGSAISTNYRNTFFAAHPELQGAVVVHHAIEQQVLTRYPGVVLEAEIHSLQNLRGIPNALNSDLHLSKIRREWNAFYRTHPNATKEELLEKATEIDLEYGSQFLPPCNQ